MLSAVIKDFGQLLTNTAPRAQITFATSGCGFGSQAQLRIFTRPLARQSSHLHAAGEEN